MKRVTSADGTEIAYETAGEGPAIVLVGGAFCDHTARAAGTPLAAKLAGHTVFTYDRRGRGESAAGGAYAVAREHEDLAAVIAVAGEADVYGHSSGAILALGAAVAGVPIRKLALYEPPLIAGTGRAAPGDDFVQRLAALPPGDAAELFLVEGVQVPAPVVAQMRKAPHWPAMEKLAPTLVHDAMITRDAVTGVEALRLPVLVLDGGRSPGWAREAVRMLAAAIPGARRETIDGATHDVDPAAVAAVLLGFF